MTQIRLNLSLIVLGAAAASGCSQGSAVIGDQATETKTGLAAYAATWDGYIEAYTFLDGSDRVRVTVTEDGTGTIRFGDHDLWPPASDPNAVYPPDFEDGAALSSCPPVAVAWDGFVYPLKNLRVEQERLRASAASEAIFGSWCSIQQPISVGSGAYACIDTNSWIAGYGPGCVGTDPDAGTSGCAAYRQLTTGPGQYELFDLPCMQAALCYDHSQNSASNGSASNIVVCTCTEAGCQPGDIPDDVIIDTALDEAQQNMAGTLALASTNYTIVLKRQ